MAALAGDDGGPQHGAPAEQITHQLFRPCGGLSLIHICGTVHFCGFHDGLVHIAQSGNVQHDGLYKMQKKVIKRKSAPKQRRSRSNSGSKKEYSIKRKPQTSSKAKKENINVQIACWIGFVACLLYTSLSYFVENYSFIKYFIITS